jgi:hypothetical protein
MSITVYPYPTLDGEVALQVVRVRIDGRPLDLSHVSTSEATVALGETERRNWQEATLDVRVTVPNDEIAYGPWAGLVCCAVLTESGTNTRIVRRLTKDRATGEWEGSVPVLRSRHRKRATLSVLVVAEVDGLAGRIVGRGEGSWVIDLESSNPARSEELQIVQVDFRDGSHSWLRACKDAPWLVDTAGDTPTVYINTAVEGLSVLLNGGSTPLERATAEMIGAQIVAEAWAAMFHTAVADLELDQAGRPQSPSGWQHSVLHTMLPDVLPGLTAFDALDELHSRRTAGRGWADLQHRILYAAGRRAHLQRRLTTTVRAVARAQEGTER